MTREAQAAELAALLTETGERHHEAFAATDGEDAEWPLWYSQYVQDNIGSHLGVKPTRSKIVQCLLNADDAHNAEGSDLPWASFYADYLLGLDPEALKTSSKPG